MNLSISGLPVMAVAVGFIVVFSFPIWLAARVAGVAQPTLLRCAGSLIVGTIGSIIALAAGGTAGLLLAPLMFLLSFKFVLGTSFLGRWFSQFFCSPAVRRSLI